MIAARVIDIPHSEFLRGLNINQMLFYFSLLAGIGDKATALRLEPGGSLGKVLLSVEKMEYEMAPNSKEDVEELLISLLCPVDKWIKVPFCRFFRKNKYEIIFCVKVMGKATHIRASMGKKHSTLYFIEPGEAADEAAFIGKEIATGKDLDPRFASEGIFITPTRTTP